MYRSTGCYIENNKENCIFLVCSIKCIYFVLNISKSFPVFRFSVIFKPVYLNRGDIIILKSTYKEQ